MIEQIRPDVPKEEKIVNHPEMVDEAVKRMQNRINRRRKFEDRIGMKLNKARNTKCPCGSGRKVKQCCGRDV